MTWGSNPEPDPPDWAGQIMFVIITGLLGVFAVLAIVSVIQQIIE